MIYIAIRSVVQTFSDLRTAEAEVFVLAVDGVLRRGRSRGFGLGLAGSDEDIDDEENGHTEDHKGAIVTWSLSDLLFVIEYDLWSFYGLCWFFLKRIRYFWLQRLGILLFALRFFLG